jgi:autotransporter-associated beta strand protein
MKSPLLFFALFGGLPALAADTISTATFSTAGNTEGWAGNPQTTVASGTADAAFPNAPVLAATLAAGATAGSQVRPYLTFPAVTLDETDEFLQITCKVRFAGNLVADRRFQACFWDTTTEDGYLAYVRAGTSTLTSQFVKQATVPATGVMNGGGTGIAATGDTTQSLGTSQTAVRTMIYRIRRTSTGMELFFQAPDDAGTTRTLTGNDTSGSPFATFDRFEMTFWGNTVPLNLDDVEIVTGIYVAPPPDAAWDGEGADANWSTVENWSGDAAPQSGANLVFGPAVSPVSVNDLAAGQAVGNVVFGAGAIGYDLSGNPVAISGKLENLSTSAQAIDLPFTLEANLALQATSAPLYLDGAVTGPHGLTKSGAQPAELAGPNSYTGVTTVQQGVLSLAGDQTGVTGGMVVSNATASTLWILPEADAAVAAGNLIHLGNDLAVGTSTATLDVEGSLANAGTLNAFRGSFVHVRSGGIFLQSGAAELRGVGGYSATLTVHPGGEFAFTGTGPFKLTASPSNTGAATVAIAGGSFVTGSGFANETATSTSTATGLILSGNGTLKLTADVPDLLATPAGAPAVFRFDGDGGTVDTNGFSATLAVPLTGSGAFVKAGAGTLASTGTNAHTGSTTVQGGTLSLAGPNLGDEAAVTVASGATLHLGFTGEDTVGSLTLGPNTLLPGTYNAATHPAFLSGSGSLVIVADDPFAAWIDGFTALTDPADKEKDADPDGDGLDNLTEFALDGDPTSGAATGKVVAKIDAGFLTLTLPVLDGAAFTGSGPLTASAGGCDYQIDGTGDLSGFSAGVEEVPALSAGLPAPLSAGWSYRTFRLTTPVSGAAKGFLRADITAAP